MRVNPNLWERELMEKPKKGLPAGVKIVGVSRVDVNLGDAEDAGEEGRDGWLYLELVGSDGGIYRTWWGQSDLRRFVNRTDREAGPPIGSAIN